MEISKDALYNLYVTRRLTAQKIATFYGYCSSQTVFNNLRKYGIPARHGKEAQRTVEIPRETLENLYIKRKMSTRRIAIFLNYGSDEAVRRLLIKYEIKRRTKTEMVAGKNKGIPMSDNQKKKLSATRIYKIKQGEIIHWNIGRNCPDDVRRKISLSLLNGRAPADAHYGPDWKVQRTSCLQRDNYKCQQCGSSDRLHVHHWDPFRFSSDNSLDNLVTLCASCHSNIHQQYHREGFIADAEAAFYA